VGGQADLKAKQLIAVGDPKLRFKEDHLRILRGFRFAGQLGFDLDGKTLLAMKESSSDLSQISKERIQVEIEKLFKSPYAYKVIEDLIWSGTWSVIFPDLTFIKNDKLRTLFKASLIRDISNLNLVFAGLFCLQREFDKSFSLKNYISVLKDSKYSKKFLKHLESTLSAFLKFEEVGLAGQVRILGSSCGAEALQLLSKYAKLGEETLPLAVKRYLLVADESGVLPPNFITAQDLIEQGLSGQAIGKTLDWVYDLQLTGKVNSRREALMRSSGANF